MYDVNTDSNTTSDHDKKDMLSNINKYNKFEYILIDVNKSNTYFYNSIAMNFEEKYKISSTFKNDSNSSLLLIRHNPHIKNDFVIVDSSFKIHYFSMKQNEIYKIITFAEHRQRVNDICFLKRSEDIFKTAFFSASSDGTIKLWNTNSNTSINTIRSKKYIIITYIVNEIKEVFSLDIMDDILAIGCDFNVNLYNLKTMKSVSSCDFAHSNFVTNVKFKQINKNKQDTDHYLLTGGEDGIINLFHVQNGLEEESVVNTINANQSLNNIGFVDDNIKFIDYCTCVQTFNIFSMDTYLNYFEFDAKSVS